MFRNFMTKTIAFLACLDTKGTEVAFVRDMILRLGHRPLLIVRDTEKVLSVPTEK